MFYRVEMDCYIHWLLPVGTLVYYALPIYASMTISVVRVLQHQSTEALYVFGAENPTIDGVLEQHFRMEIEKQFLFRVQGIFLYILKVWLFVCQIKIVHIKSNPIVFLLKCTSTLVLQWFVVIDFFYMFFDKSL